MNDVHNIWIELRNELLNTMQSLCEMILQREQAANLSNHTPEPSRRFNSICYDDDDDDDDEESTIPLNEIVSQIPSSIAITPVLLTMEHEESFVMEDEDLHTILEKESDEFIKSSVEDLVSIPRESVDTSNGDKECDWPFCDNFVIFSNPLFDYISSDVNPLFNEVLEDIETKDSYVPNLDEPAFLVTPLFDANEDECFDPGGDIDEIDAFLDTDVSMNIEDDYHDSEGDIIYLESLLINDTISNFPPESCGKDAHIGYNYPSKVLVISNSEPCKDQTIDELPQTLPSFHPTFHSEAESPFTLDSTPTYVDESPNVFNPPPQPFVYPCEFCGNDAYYCHYCTPQASFIYPEPCYNQDFNFPQDFQNVLQQYPCCDDCGVTHEAYQCQPINEVYSYGQNSCYDSTSIGFDQSQPQQYFVNHPIFNAHNDYLDSQIQLNSTLAKLTEQMTSFTSFCEMACQFVQKKQEEKQLEEERATKAQNWKLPVCFDDDDDKERSNSLKDNIIFELPPCSAITPNELVLSTEEPDNSLSMGDEHLYTIPVTESDEVIKSSVEDLIPIPSESEGIPDHMCDVPFHDNSPLLDVSKDQFKDFFESNDELSSTDDDSFSIDKIDYVEASPLDSELISSEVMEIVIPEVGGIDDDILHENLSNVNHLFAKLKASNENPIPFYDPIISGTPLTLTPSGESDFFLEGDILLFEAFLNDDHSFDFKTKSSSTSLNSLLEETNNFDNSLPEFTTFSNVLFDAEYESDSSDDQSCSDEDVLEKIVSKPLFEEEIIPMKIDQHPDNAESDLMESLRSSLLISSKIDSLLDEFASELALLKLIPLGIDETDCDFEEDIRLIKKLLYDNSSPRLPKEFVYANSDAEIESFSPSPILVKDSDSLMKEIDLFCTPDYPMPPGIEDDDYDSERDILIRKDLPSNNTLSFAEKESFHFDIPSFSRPPAKPPD
nr:hypothetical protein [Tanacetum cinerariifolium]